MRTRVVWLTAVLLIGFMGFSPSRAQEIVNILENGGFEDGVADPWGTYGSATSEVVEELVGAAVPEEPIEGDYCLHVVVSAAGAEWWEVGLNQGGLVFEDGKQYTLSAFLKCSEGTLDINFKPEMIGDPWTGYAEQTFTMTEEWTEISVTTPVFTEDVSPAEIVFHVGFVAGEFWIDDIKWYEGEYVPTVIEEKVKAEEPIPEDGAVDVPRDTTLSWVPGPFADTHDVYLGMSFDDVNDADRDNPLGVLLSQGQTDTTYDLPDLLDFSQTYYWRIDEVNAPPDSSVFKGDVWSFTVEPFAYPILGENITATASSSEADKAPENSVNGSGLDASGLLHNSIGSGNMWLSSPDGNQPSFIEYEFDKVYRLHEMWVWNSNESLEPIIGIGFRDVTIEYSVNGSDFTTLGATHEFAQAPGMDGYAHNTTIDFSDVAAKYVKLTANSNWGGILNQYGLSEVRFFYISVHAKEPSPASGATGVALEPTLSWRVGREAAEHNVYFSDDEQSVIDGTANVTTVTDNSYGPLDFDLGRTYYWRVDEVNNAETPSNWQGEVWDFTTFEYFVIDDFEDYNDFPPDRIFDTWIDGYGIATNGSTAGYAEPDFDAGEHFVETAIVNSGAQSMPYFFDNTTAGNSEATMTLSTRRNWTEKGTGSLTLWFRGHPVSQGSFTEDPAGTYTMTASGVDIWDQADEFHYAYRTLSGVGSIIARVESIDNTDPWAKAGVMIRETLEPGSKHAFVCVTPESGVSFQNRLTADSDSFSTDQAGIITPHWVKLERGMTGVFTASHSTNGTNWVPVEGATSQYIQMGTNVYIGLALTSHNPDAVCTAVFSNVQFEGTVGPTWSNQDIGILSNPAEKMYVVLNGSAVVYNDNPEAAQIGEWTEWNIDLQEFADQGVDLTDVDTLGIGFGDRENPQPGGSGVVYFDDIRLYPPLSEPVTVP